MGSWGRQEPTLLSDQDNFIIWSDTAEGPEVNEWFLDFGKKVCTDLNDLGYLFCKGGNMAMNPQWIKSLGEWKDLFRSWITTPQVDEILRIMIFFDFRAIYGDTGLADELRREILEKAPANPVFLWNLAQGCVSYKIRSATEGNTFDAKQALRPVIDYARLQALSHGIEETGTLARLHRLYEKEVLNAGQHRNAHQIFEYLSQMRLRHQYRQLENGIPLDNVIILSELSEIDRDSLHRHLDQTHFLQNWVKREYKGMSL
jgi:CBS domain-containing protein